MKIQECFPPDVIVIVEPKRPIEHMFVEVAEEKMGDTVPAVHDFMRIVFDYLVSRGIVDKKSEAPYFSGRPGKWVLELGGLIEPVGADIIKYFESI